MSGYGFPNAFQLFNLNKDTVATTLQATLARHAMNATIDPSPTPL